MPRRKDQAGGVPGVRWLAGPDGSLFLQGDGTSTVFDALDGEVYPDREAASWAWERARVITWRHEDREEVWPPAGAAHHDRLGSRTAVIWVGGKRDDVLAAVDEDLAGVERFRRERPDAAETIDAELAELEHTLQLIAGAVAMETEPDLDPANAVVRRRIDRWPVLKRIVRRADARDDTA